MAAFEIICGSGNVERQVRLSVNVDSTCGRCDADTVTLERELVARGDVAVGCELHASGAKSSTFAFVDETWTFCAAFNVMYPAVVHVRVASWLQKVCAAVLLGWLLVSTTAPVLSVQTPGSAVHVPEAVVHPLGRRRQW